MSVLRDPFARVQRIHDRSEPVDLIDDDSWSTPKPKFVTDEQVEQFIADLVTANGYHDGVQFNPMYGSLYLAVARQWIRNKEAVGEIVGPVFWAWAKAAAHNVEFGKPIALPSLALQAG